MSGPVLQGGTAFQDRPFCRFCRDPLYRGALCDPKGSMAFLQNNFRCTPIGYSKNLKDLKDPCAGSEDEKYRGTSLPSNTW